MFPVNDKDKLSNILDEIQKPLLKRRAQVENMTWEGYARDLINFINKLKK